MKKKFLALFLFIPLIVFAQRDSTSHDTLILDKFFNFVGRNVKKAFQEAPIDTVGRGNSSKQKCKFGFAFSYSASGIDDFFDNEYFCPSLTLNYKRSFYALGPKFFWYDITGIEFRNPGMQMIYQVNPFKEHKFLNFYLQYNIGFLREKYRYLSSEWNGTTTIFVPVKHTVTCIENIIGYGIRLNVYKGFYLYQNLGIGLVFQKDYYRYALYSYRSGLTIKTERVNLFMVGLGFRFNYKK